MKTLEQSLQRLQQQANKDLPPLTIVHIEDNATQVQLAISHSLPCLDGHFPDNPVVPGVAQIHWVGIFAKAFFGEGWRFHKMSTVKFHTTIIPDCVVNVRLKADPHKGLLHFRYDATDGTEQTFSEGKLHFLPIHNARA